MSSFLASFRGFNRIMGSEGPHLLRLARRRRKLHVVA
jgi:hypothetical protein